MAEFLKLEHFLKPIWKLEAMMDLHLLSDPVTEFWKCPKKGLFFNWIHKNSI